MKLILFFFTLCLLTVSTSFAVAKQTPPTQTIPRKQKLVLIPIVLSDSEQKLRGQIETSLVSGLQEKYTVFSGENVLQKHREIMTKESKESKGLCDETKCMQDLAEGFGSELVAVVHVTKEEGNLFTSGRYILSINIQNIFDNKAIYNKIITSKNTDSVELLDKLQELGRGDIITQKEPEVVTPMVREENPIKPTQPTKADAENELWAEAQKGNTADDYTAYLETYPKGKYSSLAKARIKKFKAEPIAQTLQKVENSPDNESLLWSEAQKGNTADDYTAYLETYPKGKYASLAKTRIKKVKTETVIQEEPIVQVPQPTRSFLPGMAEATIQASPKPMAAKPSKNTNLKDVWIDNETGLMWQDDIDAKTVEKDWQGAMDYCHNLTLAGYDDWKLPDKETLLDLVKKDDALKNKVINFGWGPWSPAYWTSTTKKGMLYGKNAFVVDTRFGGMSNDLDTTTHNWHVRCVRDNK